MVCIDAEFAVSGDKSSQLGIASITRVSKTGSVNIVHYASATGKRVCNSVLAAKLFTFVDGFNVGYVLVSTLGNVYGRDPSLALYTDSRSLYGLCISFSQTTERRLLINLALIREVYERQDISDVFWIGGRDNSADDLTKPERDCEVLPKILARNYFQQTAKSWVHRDEMEVQTRS